MTAVQTRPPLYVINPVLRTLKLLVAPVPDPRTSPIARSYNDDMTLLRMHPDLSADEIVAYALPFLSRQECRQWLAGFGVFTPIDLVYADPWRYLGHLRHLRSLPGNVPSPLRMN